MATYDSVADPTALALQRLGRHWGMVLALGILSAALGLIILAWPGRTVLVVAVLLGLWLLASGVFQVITAFAPDLDGGARAMFAISGVLSVILGALCFRGPAHRVTILVLLISLGWLARGIIVLVTGFGSPGRHGRGWLIAEGFALLVGAVVARVWPAMTLVVLAIVAGAWLLVDGVLLVIGAFRVRKLRDA